MIFVLLVNDFLLEESMVSDLVLFCVGYEAIGLDCLCGIKKRNVLQCSFFSVWFLGTERDGKEIKLRVSRSMLISCFQGFL